MCAAGLAAALVGLAIIGRPPAVRVDALWVNGHREEVRVCLLAVAIAAAGTMPALFHRRRRWIVGALWLLAVAAAGVFFSDAIRIIARVLVERAW